MKKLVLFFMLMGGPVFAQATADQYWQQLVASKEAQSSQQIVSLAQQLDEARKKIIELQKQLADKNEKQEK